VPAVGDAPLLRQVLANLLGNCIKFTRTRPAALIEVSSTFDGSECTYAVRDNGVGFDMTYVDKLFRVFQRLHRATEFEGTGIGLAIVARIVDRHGGRAWAESVVGEGATFWFTLPGVDSRVAGGQLLGGE
jgi:chemotaxis family two-component system sensor kinase Cph1